jgi:probable F420-dependent oxidoreductase
VHARTALVLGYRRQQHLEQRVAEREDGEALVFVTGPDQSRLVPSIPSEVVVEEQGSVEHLAGHPASVWQAPAMTSLSGTGIWSSGLRYGDAGTAAAHAKELEELGYTALWLPDVGGDLFTSVANLLGATSTATIATGILNIWMHTPEETATHHAALTADHGSRFLCGVGISHRPFIDIVKSPGAYDKPLATMAAFLDGLDGADPPLAKDDRVIAALGPKMLELARTRAAGTHPYLVTPELTAKAREGIGPDGLVASEQGVVLDTNPESARATARLHLQTYLGLPNYSNNWKRQGFTDGDLADGGSDRLVDALVVWGDEAAIADRVEEHRDAGADHVCIQVLTDDPVGFPADQWRALAPALTA